MTINDSEQQVSNYHITRPVLESSPLFAHGEKNLISKQTRNTGGKKIGALNSAYHDKEEYHSNYAISTAKRGSSAQIRKSNRDV